MADLENPCKVFLKHCTAPLDGICRFNEKRLLISGSFGQNITVVELIADWVGSFVKVSPNIGRHRKDVLYI